MIPAKVLRQVARQRLKDARTLLEGKRYDCAAYMCGYVVELALKARICRTLRWEGYPETRADLTARRMVDAAATLLEVL